MMTPRSRYSRAAAATLLCLVVLSFQPSEAARRLHAVGEGEALGDALQDAKAAAESVATDAELVSTDWPEAFSPGLWFTSGRIFSPSGYPELQKGTWEGKTGMLFTHPGVAEVLIYVFSEKDPSVSRRRFTRSRDPIR